MFAFFGNLIGAVVGGVGAAAGGAASAIGTAGGAVVSGAGQVIGGAGQVIGGAARGVGSAVFGGESSYVMGTTGAGRAVYGVRQTPGIFGGIGSAIGGLPGTVGKYKPIIDVIGGAYGVYQSYQQKEQADKVAETYERQTTAPVFIAPSTPGMSEGFRTIVDVQLPPEYQEMKEAYALQEHDTERLVKYGLIAVVAYIILTRV